MGIYVLDEDIYAQWVVCWVIVLTLRRCIMDMYYRIRKALYYAYRNSIRSDRGVIVFISAFKSGMEHVYPKGTLGIDLVAQMKMQKTTR